MHDHFDCLGEGIGPNLRLDLAATSMTDPLSISAGIAM